MVLNGARFEQEPTTDYKVHNEQVGAIAALLKKKYTLKEYSKEEGKLLKNTRIYYSGGKALAQKLGATNNYLFMVLGDFDSGYDSFTCQTCLQYGPLNYKNEHPEADF